MKRYFVQYYEFGNSYSLRHAETQDQEVQLIHDGYDRITRKEAFRLCAAERYREKYDHSFSGYADDHIFPADYDGYNEDPFNSRLFRINGYIVERVNPVR